MSQAMQRRPFSSQQDDTAGAAGQMLFILSPPRSYSTVTTAMLGNHPDVYAFPEMLLFTATTVDGLLNEAERQPELPKGWFASRLSGPFRAIADLTEGDQSPAAIQRARDWLSQRADWTTVRLMNHLRSLTAARIAVEKSPDTVGSSVSLAYCLESYPRALYLHLTRHPATTQASMHAYWRTIYAGHERELVAAAATSWYTGHSRIAATLAELPRKQWMRVKAEDLLRQPRVILPRILDWLGLECSEEILGSMTRTERWCFAYTDPNGAVGGGDIKFLLRPALRSVPAPGPVVFSREWGLTREMTARMIRLAADLGY